MYLSPVERLGRRVRDLRLALGWTQGELAERAGIPLDTLHGVEHGKGERGPTWGTVIKLATALGVGVEEFTRSVEVPPQDGPGRPRKPKDGE